VPQLPSVHIEDLAEAVCPGVDREVSEIRPGEKIHETLISQDEARHALLHENLCLYTILPPPPFPRRTWLEGESLAEGFAYSSDKNVDWLKGDALKEALE
jgi:UDP-N-acetylglucosamine 4,6-dehydratase